MKRIFKYVVQSGFIAAAAIASSPVHAAGSGYSEYVSSISFDRSQGIHIDVVLKNTSANKHIDAVNIQSTKSNMNIDFSGTVKCEKNKKSSQNIKMDQSVFFLLIQMDPHTSRFRKV